MEDQTRAFLVIGEIHISLMSSRFTHQTHQTAAWESIKARNAFKATADYSTVIEQLEAARVGPVDALHVDVDGDRALSSLTRPTTELVVCKLKDGVVLRPLQVKSTVDAIVDTLLGDSDEVLHPPSTYLKTVELPKACCIAVGWDAPQVCDSVERSRQLSTDFNTPTDPASQLQRSAIQGAIHPPKIRPDRRTYPCPCRFHEI